jgi:CelD/BcsL family acetyltransferase involved in cellulose biosynthesis
MQEMPVDWTDDPTAFVGRDWTSLAESDPEGTIFHTPGYLKPYWEEFGSAALRLAFVLDGDEAVAVAAFDVSEGTVSFLGGSEITDYMGPVGFPQTRERAAKELMASLATRDDWETGDLRGLLETSGWHRALQQGAHEADLEVEAVPDGTAPLIGLPSSFDAYLSSLPGRMRHEVRRKRRRIGEALPSAHLVDATETTLAGDFDRFVELHRSTSGSKGKFMYPGMELFFRRLGQELLPRRAFRLVFLEADGAKIAGAVGFPDRGRFLLYNSAYDHAHSALSPGMALLTMLVEDLIGMGSEGLDLLKGDEEYKRRMGARPRRLVRLLLHRR